MAQAEYARARAVLQEGQALAQQRRDPVATGEASTYLGPAMVVAGEVEEGTRRLHGAVRRWEVLGDPQGLGEALCYLGYAANVKGDTAAAAACYIDALQWLDARGAATARVTSCMPTTLPSLRPLSVLASHVP